MPEHRAGLARAQHVAVIDAVSPERHRGHQRHDLAARVRRPRPVAEIDRLDRPAPRSRAAARAAPAAAPQRSRRPAHHRTRPRIASGESFTMRVTSCAGPAAAGTARLACSGGHLNLSPGQLPTKNGGSRLTEIEKAPLSRAFQCARMDSNHHGEISPQGPQPRPDASDASAGVHSKRFARVRVALGHIWRGVCSHDVLTAPRAMGRTCSSGSVSAHGREAQDKSELRYSYGMIGPMSSPGLRRGALASRAHGPRNSQRGYPGRSAGAARSTGAV
jgi:hypothetical protein